MTERRSPKILQRGQVGRSVGLDPCSPPPSVRRWQPVEGFYRIFYRTNRNRRWRDGTDGDGRCAQAQLNSTIRYATVRGDRLI